jgi:2-dehydropantoate 2-reductase
MRFVIYGAGAIGGALGVSLANGGSDVVLIARGAQYEAIRGGGLTLELPDGPVNARVPVVAQPSELDLGDGDVVVLAMKSQDTEPALRALSEHAPTQLPIVCMQNGVENERLALRRFEHVYGAMVIAPATFLAAGSVVVTAAPNLGLAELGRYPSGSDALCEEIAAVFSASQWASRAVEDIMSWKYAKLLDNLSNAAQVVVGLTARGGTVATRARAEGVEVLDRAGIGYLARDQIESRRAEAIISRPVEGRERVGASTWQSVARGTGSVESDYLNGEIVLIARRHGGSAPVNALLQRLSNEIARSAGERGPINEEQFLALLED